MMYPRLFLARNLLLDSGVLLVSIDEHEVHNLRHLLDEVFGQENFIAQLVWEKTRKNDAKYFSVGHEYVLVYARSFLTLREQNTVWREAKEGAQDIEVCYRRLREQFGDDNQKIQTELRAWYQSLDDGHPSKAMSRYKHVDDRGVWRDRDISWPGTGGPRYDVIHPITQQPCAVPPNGWRFTTPEAMEEQIAKGYVHFRQDHTKPPFRKAYLSDKHHTGDEETTAGLQVMSSVIYKQAQVATKYLRKLLGGSLFENPKDHEIIARLISYCVPNGNSHIVMDFFAGSGSTADAVYRLNAADGGDRKFVLVQLPQETPAESPAREAGYRRISDLCCERIRRVSSELKKAESGTLTAHDSDLGFRTFRLAPSNFKTWNGSETDIAVQLKLYAENMTQEATADSLLFEIMLKSGLSLTAPVERVDDSDVFTAYEGLLVVVLADEINKEVLDAIYEIEPLRVICRDAAFDGDDELKTNTVLEMKSHGIEFRTV